MTIKKLINNIPRNTGALSWLLITFYTLLAFAPHIPFLGFYGDDIYFLYIGHFFGTEGLIQSLSLDRPFDGYLMALGYHFLKDSIYLWHVYMLALRLLSGYSLFFLLKLLWPNKLFITTTITLLFTLYPGFLLQTSPLGFHLQVMNLSVYIISIIFTILAIRSGNTLRKLLFTFLAIVFQLAALLIFEYYIGMEVFRLVLIVYILKFDHRGWLVLIRKNIRKLCLNYLPYFVGITVFIGWRFFIFHSGRNETSLSWVSDIYYTNSVWIITRLLELLYSFVSTVGLAYFLPLLLRFLKIPWYYFLSSLVASLILGSLFYLYYLKHGRSKQIQLSETNKILGKELVILGTISLLGALIPIIAMGRYVRLFMVFDRYTLTGLIGAIFIIIGIVLWKIPEKLRALFVIILIIVSVTTHLTNGFQQALYWDQQKQLWWQLYWRSDGIQNDTMLIFDFPKLSNDSLQNRLINQVGWNRLYWVDYQIYGLGNLLFNYYYPDEFIAGDYLSDTGVAQKVAGNAIELTESNKLYSSVIKNFKGIRHYENSVIISAPSDKTCLWVIESDKGEISDNSNSILEDYTIHSKADLLTISSGKQLPPSRIFGTEPQHSWCYFFQKASLYRQQKNWDKLSIITEEVLEKELAPKDDNEWLPFIEGMIVSKDYSKASALIDRVVSQGGSNIFINNLCRMTDRLEAMPLFDNCN